MKGKEEKHYEKLLKERIGEALRQRKKRKKWIEKLWRSGNRRRIEKDQRKTGKNRNRKTAVNDKQHTWVPVCAELFLKFSDSNFVGLQ